MEAPVQKPSPEKTAKEAVLPVQETEQQIAETVRLPAEALMPELEELVKKNPNRLIGCGG